MKQSTKQIVRGLMKNSKTLRDDDRLLSLHVWEQYGLHLMPNQKAIFMHCPTMVSIARRRRELNAEFPASEKATERRYKEFKNYRDYYGAFWRRVLRRHL